MRPIIFNGKFYSGQLNGVHRVADRLVREVDRILQQIPAADRPDVRLLLPQSRTWTPEVQAISLIEQRHGHTQFWEQLILPLKARGAVLVNLCNLAPIAVANKVLLLHDVQFLFPDNGYPARQRWGHRLLTPWMMRTSAQPMTVSQYSRAMIDLTGLCPRARVDVLYNGADHIVEVEAADLPEEWDLETRPYVLMFGSTKGYKNVDIVFEAFRSSLLATATLVVVGQGEAEHQRAGFAPPTNALFVGTVGDAVLRRLYEGAICLATPSRTEGFGLPPLEAMYLGCPAVVAPSGAMPEIYHDAVSYADVDDPDDWARAISRLMLDAAYRDGKIRDGLCRARQFTWERSGAALWDKIIQLALGAANPLPVFSAKMRYRPEVLDVTPEGPPSSGHRMRPRSDDVTTSLMAALDGQPGRRSERPMT
jgi:glycosyltransferase involved in cell wall biosynthesis